MRCPISSIFDFGNSTYWWNAVAVVKIRISKYEIRDVLKASAANNIRIQMFEIENKCTLAVLISVFVIEISVI